MSVAPGEHRTLRATDGYPLTYRHWSCSQPWAQIVLLNGMMSHAGWFEPFVPHFQSHGIELVGADRRGSGHNTVGRGDAPSAQQLVEDVIAILHAHATPGVPQVLLGWCWGAALSIVVAHRCKAELAGLVLVTPGLCPTSAIRAAMDAQDERREDPADVASIESPIQERWFTSGPALEGFILRDPLRVMKITPRMVEVSRKLATAATLRLKKIDLPLLLVLAEDDEATDNAATLALFESARGSDHAYVTVPGRHGVQFDAPRQTTEHIVACLEAWQGARTSRAIEETP